MILKNKLFLTFIGLFIFTFISGILMKYYPNMFVPFFIAGFVFTIVAFGNFLAGIIRGRI